MTVAAAGFFAVGLSACAHAPREGASLAPAVANGSSPATAQAAPAPLRHGPAVKMTDFEGRSSDELGAIFEPAQERLQACGRGTGGKVMIRVKREDRRTRFDVEPGSSLDPSERRCVLEALSTSNLDDGATVNQGANVRPTGFTSLITVDW